MKGSTHPAASYASSYTSSHLFLCSLPGANELLMAAEPLINPPFLPPSLHSSPLSCPPVLPPPPSLLAELHPHWLLLLTVCQHISGDLVRIFFCLHPPPPPSPPLSVFNHFFFPPSLPLARSPSLPPFPSSFHPAHRPSFLFSALSFLLP